MLKFMKAKIHRFKVTSSDVNYIGSITIDEDILEMVGILPLEEVEIVNITNGNRWSTYALPGKRGSGHISPNGGGALLCKPGDILIIFAYELKNLIDLHQKGHIAKVVIGDENNFCTQSFAQTLTYENGKLTFDPSALLHKNTD